ncbi:MAG: glycosyltransferase [Sumerlaeia bacterium]
MPKPVLVVLDAHYFWTRELFSNCSGEFDVLLLKPRDFRAQKAELGKYCYQHAPKFVSNGVWEQHIPMPPGWLFNFWFISARFIARSIKKFAGNRPITLVYCYPYYASLAKLFPCKSVYYSIDDYNDYWPGREAQTALLEKHCVEMADACVCVSDYRTQLFRGYKQHQPERILHLPHGCHREFMVEAPLLQPLPLKENLQAFNRPVCGYIGALNNRFDFPFLAEVAAKLPDIQFVLGGTEPNPGDGSSQWYTGYKLCVTRDNVHFMGRIPHDQVGKTLQSFDVLLMPYAKCAFNTSACPMKLWDYMGTSRPVVANDAVPEVLLWQHVIHIGTEPAEFAAKIEESLADPSWMAQARLEIARDNTWKNQAERLCSFLPQQGLLAF